MQEQEGLANLLLIRELGSAPLGPALSVVTLEQTVGMANYGTRLLLFLSSYSPLAVILAVQHWDRRVVAGALLGVAVASILALILFLQVALSAGAYPTRIARASLRDGDLVGYIVAYLLPFLGIDFSKSRDAISLGILLLVIGVLYAHSNLIYVNPVLATLGYHLFEVEEDGGRTIVVLSRKRYLEVGREISVVSLGNYVALEKGTHGTGRRHRGT